MKNMEELRLEVGIEFGGEFENIDPVMEHYKIICNSIYALLKEENLIDIIEDATQKEKESKKGIKQAYKKRSVAKEILLTALMHKKQSKFNEESLKDDQLVEMELLKDKV